GGLVASARVGACEHGPRLLARHTPRLPALAPRRPLASRAGARGLRLWVRGPESLSERSVSRGGRGSGIRVSGGPRGVRSHVVRGRSERDGHRRQDGSRVQNPGGERDRVTCSPATNRSSWTRWFGWWPED